MLGSFVALAAVGETGRIELACMTGLPCVSIEPSTTTRQPTMDAIGIFCGTRSLINPDRLILRKYLGGPMNGVALTTTPSKRS
jgi:hypothetical protein